MKLMETVNDASFKVLMTLWLKDKVNTGAGNYTNLRLPKVRVKK